MRYYGAVAMFCEDDGDVFFLSRSVNITCGCVFKAHNRAHPVYAIGVRVTEKLQYYLLWLCIYSLMRSKNVVAFFSAFLVARVAVLLL